MKRPSAALLFLFLVPFSLWLVATQGFGPLIPVVSDVGWGTQIFMDLFCAITISGFFVHQHARARDVNPWPWIIGAYFIGSPAPITYFLIYGAKGPKESP